MDSKIIQLIFVLTLSLQLINQVQGCKVYCLSCPSNFDYPSYYCCMEEGETELSDRDCGYEPTSVAPTPNPTPTPTATPTPTPTPTATPCPPQKNRCPDPNWNSPIGCDAYQKLYPNPTQCISDEDCAAYPFNVCCEDKCFSTKICKTAYNNVEIE